MRSSRVLWALLLLAAVFGMHGLTCVAASADLPGTSSASAPAAGAPAQHLGMPGMAMSVGMPGMAMSGPLPALTGTTQSDSELPVAAVGVVVPSASVVPSAGSATPALLMTSSGHSGPGVSSPVWSSLHDQPGGHSTGMHAFVVCLAVLAAGVGAALLSWVASRLVARLQPVVHTAGAELRDRVDRFLIGPPAPDLSRLCVLRV